MICKQCQHRKHLIRHRSGGHTSVWKCEKLNIWFGYQFEYNAGNNMPNKCDNFQLDEYAFTRQGQK